ncbi:uncharacterized protein BYT42DRAFT_585292 [Radiomyces spectabilis]|uniref:uncharacterized protein n=1 Tax=Radiomyces spectabilis TaxID=64574 RepID=UPI00221F38E2|nr:uncharacterized protein BYT42DRAFT_585292 [Radiomyces spectabilis]KAI8368104.1 hypothetical protein BYT42DRAFT_585292 [Radiomyces spectabilis]
MLTTVTTVEDSILTDSYIKKITDDMEKEIDTTGHISLLAQAQHYSLPYAFVQKLLDPLLAHTKYVKYSQLPDLILTKEYVNEQSTKIKGVLYAAQEVLAMTSLQRTLDIGESLFYVLLEQLTAVPGIFRGRRERAKFEPYVYRDRQLSLITSLLEASRYIEYATVEQLYSYGNTKEVLKKHCPSVVLLETCAVTESLVEQVQESLNEVRVSQSWMDASELVPSALTAADILALLEMIVSRDKPPASPNNKLLILELRYVTTMNYLSSLVEMSQEFLNRRALSELQTQKNMHSNRGKKRVNDVELTLPQIAEYLQAQGGLPEPLATAVAVKIKRKMCEALCRAMQGVYLPGVMNDEPGHSPSDSPLLQDRRLQQQLEKEIAATEYLQRKLYFTAQAIALFQENSRKSLEKFLFRQLCSEYMYHLLTIKVLQSADNVTRVLSIMGITQADLEDAGRLHDDRRKEITAALIKSDYDDENGALQRLYEAKKSDVYIDYIESHLPAYLTFDAVKDAKFANEETQVALGDQLASTAPTPATAPLILHLTSLLCFQSLHDLPLHVSGKYVPHILKLITAELPSEQATLLTQAQDMIMAHIKSGEAINVNILNNVYDLGNAMLEKIKARIQMI